MYRAPVDGFRLSRPVLGAGGKAQARCPGPGPGFCCARPARFRVTGPRHEVVLTGGAPAYVPACESVAVSGEATVFRATVDDQEDHD